MGVYKLKTGLSYKLKTGPSSFTVFPIFIVFWGMFRNTNSAALCQNSVFAKLSGCQKEVFEKKIAIFVFVFFMLETEKQKKGNHKMEKGPKTYQNSVF